MKISRTGSKQYAVLPVHVAAGEIRVMLITSRGTKRWIVPKGWPMKGRKPGEAAMVEAFEEAGLEGEIIGRRPIGSYRYVKGLPSGEGSELRVDVYLMLVRNQLEDWPEKAQRETQWFTPLDAAALVVEPGLAKIIRKMPAMKRRSKLDAGVEFIAENGGVGLRMQKPVV